MAYIFLYFAVITLIVLIAKIEANRREKRYHQSEYYQLTGNEYKNTFHDKGTFGEYNIYNQLKQITGCRKFIFNCYIPKKDGTTTEIDVIMIHESGIYIFESKNYRGWIFGSEDQVYWTQTFKTKKCRLYNPVMQNKNHIRWLKNYLTGYENIPFYSYIVFGSRCELKNIKINSPNTVVTKAGFIFKMVSNNIKIKENVLDAFQIQEIFEKLYPLSQIDDIKKQEHIQNINGKYKKK